MKLNIKKFMMTEMGGELEETIKAWDQALEERRKATPGIGDPDQGIGFGYWDRTCKSCQDRWEVIFRKIILGEEKRKKDDSERQEGDAGR